ncbi:DUF2975 domain-containing protein [Chryseobacterium fluminis]|uniref:DUF2975 domain-containing protein n=1 Tax=Chryseobacterium fluminis TaxID=2983606 RepID=UPI0022520E21|nr:DUF2975 domain-containing protein [Chryseobacterium sp. MMS21-Ot14]UZT98350.1 DUF2975 domain-containing protein [Chryseobacterium sp. MMS21-Ot14]
MKLLGKNALLYWLKYPFGIYTVGFISVSVWIFILMAVYSVTGKTNGFISIGQWKTGYIDHERQVETVRFHYPVSRMVLATENSSEGILLAFLGLLSICFILVTVLKIIIELSKDNFFTGKAIQNFKILGLGLLMFGAVQLIVNWLIASHNLDLTSSFLFILTGLIFMFLKEIFVKGKMMQDENDLTI